MRDARLLRWPYVNNKRPVFHEELGVFFRNVREFAQWECFGHFSKSAMHKSFRLALKKLNAHRKRLKLAPVDETLHPYDFRHAFGTMVAERVTDDRAIQELMMHSRPEQQRRYTEAATAQRVRAAVEQVAMATFGGHKGGESATKHQSPTSAPTRKQQKKWRARLDSNQRPPA